MQSTPIRAQVLDSAATTEDNTALWQFATGASADEIANEGTRTRLRNRCRSEFLNNGTAAAAGRNLATYGIGKGPDLQIVGADPAVAAHLEWEFYQWAKEIGLWRKLRTVAEARYYDGESFLRWFHDPFVDDVELNIDLVDPARITTPFNSLQDEYLLDGIRYDKYNRPVEYAVMKSVPNPLLVYALIDPEWVPAEEIIHFKVSSLPGQHRALPGFQSSLHLFAESRRYTKAVIAAAEQAANISAMIETQQLPDGVEPSKPEETDILDVPRRGALILPRGHKASQMKAEQPTAAYDSFKKSIEMEIGAGVGQPRNVLSGDSSAHNYASGRLDGQGFTRFIEVFQQDLSDEVLDRIFDRWIEVRSDVDERAAQILESRNGNPRKIRREWNFAESEHVDPLKEAQAHVTMLNAGLITRQEIYGRRSRNWSEDIDQLEAEERRLATIRKLREGGTEQ